jgi:hypothetical protein
MVRHASLVWLGIERYQNLFPIGRNGVHRYNNQDHSMLHRHAGGGEYRFRPEGSRTSGRSIPKRTITNRTASRTCYGCFPPGLRYCSTILLWDGPVFTSITPGTADASRFRYRSSLPALSPELLRIGNLPSRT